jgi:peptidyl-prolyl cis-trans isomerase C
MRRWLREPLVQFLGLGLLLFLVHGILRRPTQAAKPNRITLTAADLQQLDISFTAQWQRRPTPEELTGLLESRIRQEVLYREALALGLDKEDIIVKRRMAQKMEFLTEDAAAAHEPTTAELQAWFQKNSAQFALPGRVTFRHLYFSPDRRGARAKDDAQAALARLAGKAQDAPLAKRLGDPFMFHDYLADRASPEIAKEFGPRFAQALFALVPGGWRGPVESGYGWHLVFVESKTPEQVPAFAEVEADVKTAWLAAQKAEAWDRAYAAMRAKYELALPSQIPASGVTGEAQASASP